MHELIPDKARGDQPALVDSRHGTGMSSLHELILEHDTGVISEYQLIPDTAQR